MPNMSRLSLSLGSFRGVPIKLHWSVVVLGLLFGSGLISSYGVVVGAVVLIAFLASIIAHEIGHVVAAARFGVRAESIELWALGGSTKLNREAKSPRAEGWIAAAGPLVSLAIGVVATGSAVALYAADAGRTAVAAVGWVGVVNVVLALFNMVPATPLDGGRVLKALRWSRHGDRFRAAREAASTGRAIGWFIVGAGVVLMLNGRDGLMLLITGVFIATSARVEKMSADIAEQLDGVRVGDLTWFGVAHADVDTDAETMLWQRSRLGDAGVVAVDSAPGTIAGFVSEDQLWAVPEDRRDTVSLRSLMQPLDRATRADPDEDLSAVLSRLNPVHPLITVWRDGRLLGVVPKERLRRRLATVVTS
jgi:Zn-dependent protease